MRQLTCAMVLLTLLRVLGGTAAAQAPAHPAAADAGIRELLEQYSLAFESLDPAAVKKVQPSIDAETLKAAFKHMRSLDVAITDVKVLSADASAIRVSCRVTQVLVPRAGSKQTIVVSRVLRLRRLDGALMIDAFER